jgi:hypothetical protein
VCVVQLFPRLRIVDPPPVPVRPAVRPYCHTSLQQGADAGVVNASVISQHSGQEEELGGEAVLHESGQRHLHIRRVPVVKTDSDVGPLDHRVEHLLEVRRLPKTPPRPGRVATGGADSMHRDVDKGARVTAAVRDRPTDNGITGLAPNKYLLIRWCNATEFCSARLCLSRNPRRQQPRPTKYTEGPFGLACGGEQVLTGQVPGHQLGQRGLGLAHEPTRNRRAAGACLLNNRPSSFDAYGYDSCWCDF